MSLGTASPAVSKTRVSPVGSGRHLPSKKRGRHHWQTTLFSPPPGPPRPSWPRLAPGTHFHRRVVLESRAALSASGPGPWSLAVVRCCGSHLGQRFPNAGRDLISWWHSVWPPVCQQPSGSPSHLCGKGEESLVGTVTNPGCFHPHSSLPKGPLHRFCMNPDSVARIQYLGDSIVCESCFSEYLDDLLILFSLMARKKNNMYENILFNSHCGSALNILLIIFLYLQAPRFICFALFCFADTAFFTN